MSAVAGNVELVLVTDPATLAYLISGALWFDERIATDAAIDTADVTGSLIIAGLQLYIQKQYNDLAKNYYKLYSDQRTFYYSNFQNNANGESGLLTQVFSNPLAGNGQSGVLYTPQYLAQSANVAAFDTAGAFSSVWWQDHANMYADTPFSYAHNPRGATVSGIGEPEALDKAATLDDYDTYLDRYEEHRKDVYDERTWEWQNQALNFGLKQANIVQSGLAMSFKFLDEATGNMADWFATQSNGLAMQPEYKKSFNQTSQSLAASTQRGSALSISTNLGVDRYKAFPKDIQQNMSNRIERGMDYKNA